MQKQERVTLYGMDCRDAMGLFMAENSVDSIVTDPPYGLGFMGKAWDHGVPGVEFWQHVYEVLKPGGHLLAFSGSRTYHRMVCAIEDAGFEVRDQIMWVYGSGFPKSLDVSKAIDKAAGVAFDAVPASGVGFMNAEGVGGYNTPKNQLVRLGVSTQAAQQWQGWGTALKPAHEPICVARKPLAKGSTVAANVLHWGTGALNIDACRVGSEIRFNAAAGNVAGGNSLNMSAIGMPQDVDGRTVEGRWPANLIHDGSNEVLAGFPETGKSTGGGAKNGDKFGGGYEPSGLSLGFGDTGSAARFFYCAKASKKDRNEGLSGMPEKQYSHDGRETPIDNAYQRNASASANHHPTVKPTDLMAYLCRLVTPPGGVILDPFMGSGSTGKAALREGFRFIGCELDEGYMQIAQARLAAEAGVQA